MRILQINLSTGRVEAMIDNDAIPGPMPGRVFRIVPPEQGMAHWGFGVFTNLDANAAVAVLSEKPEETFTVAPPAVNTRLSYIDVVGLLTAEEFKEMAKYGPFSPPPYDDATVIQALAIFEGTKATYVDVTDPRMAGMMQMLVAKGLMTEARVAEFQAALAALAASKEPEGADGPPGGVRGAGADGDAPGHSRAWR